ncbi:MAG: tRNA lysidine(34) synthetase TilS, partial [Gammaproteobacteria bacterium]|nr:tRNA lysidine(34) synthetase TilS [Gammaproteobacteria bacterium]
MSFVKRFQTSLESLYALPENACYVVAYSGGLDSHVLLHCCKQLKLPMRAVHIHHGLQTSADYWVKHCQNTCEELNVPVDVVYVDAQKKRGQSPEEAARIARYDALQNSLMPDDCLLTAQHLDDQSETLLLQLFRTASAAGLSGMPGRRRIGDNIHLRPLLPFTREELEVYAKENFLHWIEDPSNQDVSYDRNFIRKNVLPLLKDRWPEIAAQLSTVASLQSNNLRVLEDMAAIDLANVVHPLPLHGKTSVYEVISVLSIARLKQLTSARLVNVLRYWVRLVLSDTSEDDRATKNSPTRK